MSRSNTHAQKETQRQDAVQRLTQQLQELSFDELHNRVDNLSTLLKIQGYDGNWNYDAYMHGLYNGMELMLSTLERREVNIRKAPRVWKKDQQDPATLQPVCAAVPSSPRRRRPSAATSARHAVRKESPPVEPSATTDPPSL